MSKENSPRYLDGRDDGTEDALTLSMCPPGIPLGPRPPNPDYPRMYMYGYEDAFVPSPCACDGSCKLGKPYGWVTEQNKRAAQNVQKTPVGSHNTGQ